ncbi:MAG: hypothetical protein MHM6MM_001900 [Cercozoa sp. M6MM]
MSCGSNSESCSRFQRLVRTTPRAVFVDLDKSFGDDADSYTCDMDPSELELGTHRSRSPSPIPKDYETTWPSSVRQAVRDLSGSGRFDRSLLWRANLHEDELSVASDEQAALAEFVDSDDEMLADFGAALRARGQQQESQVTFGPVRRKVEVSASSSSTQSASVQSATSGSSSLHSLSDTLSELVSTSPRPRSAPSSSSSRLGAHVMPPSLTGGGNVLCESPPYSRRSTPCMASHQPTHAPLQSEDVIAYGDATETPTLFGKDGMENDQDDSLGLDPLSVTMPPIPLHDEDNYSGANSGFLGERQRPVVQLSNAPPTLVFSPALRAQRNAQSVSISVSNPQPSVVQLPLQQVSQPVARHAAKSPVVSCNSRLKLAQRQTPASTTIRRARKRMRDVQVSRDSAHGMAHDALAQSEMYLMSGSDDDVELRRSGRRRAPSTWLQELSAGSVVVASGSAPSTDGETESRGNDDDDEFVLDHEEDACVNDVAAAAAAARYERQMLNESTSSGRRTKRRRVGNRKRAGNGNKVYKCSICGQVFMRSHLQLNAHMKVHKKQQLAQQEAAEF